MALSEPLGQTVSFYQTHGVKIGVLPHENHIYNSECLLNYLTNTTGNHNMAAAVAACPNGLGLLFDLTLLVFDILKVPRSKQLVFQSVNDSIQTGFLNWSGILDGVSDGLYDTSLPEFAPNTARLQVCDFSIPVLRPDEVYATKLPNHRHGVQVHPLSMFSTGVWITFLTLGTMIACLLLALESPTFPRKSWNLADCFVSFMERTTECTMLFTGFSMYISSAQRKSAQWHSFVPVVLGLWALVSEVLVGLYCGTILFSIVECKQHLPFKDIPSLAACVSSKKCYLFHEGITVNYQRIVEGIDLSNDEMLLRRAVQKNPNRISRNISAEIFESELHQYPVYYGDRGRLHASEAAGMHHNSWKQYYIMANKDMYDSWCFPTKKHSNLSNYISNAITRAFQYGLVDALYHRYLPSSLDKTHVYKEFPKPFDIVMLSGTLTILAAGLSIGLLALIVEMVLQVHMFYQSEHAHSRIPSAEFYHWNAQCRKMVDRMQFLLSNVNKNGDNDTELLKQLANRLDSITSGNVNV